MALRRFITKNKSFPRLFRLSPFEVSPTHFFHSPVTSQETSRFMSTSSNSKVELSHKVDTHSQFKKKMSCSSTSLDSVSKKSSFIKVLSRSMSSNHEHKSTDDALSDNDEHTNPDISQEEIINRIPQIELATWNYDQGENISNRVQIVFHSLANILCYDKKKSQLDFTQLPATLKINEKRIAFYAMQNFKTTEFNSPNILQAFEISGWILENFIPLLNYLFGSTATSFAELDKQFSDERRNITFFRSYLNKFIIIKINRFDDQPEKIIFSESRSTPSVQPQFDQLITHLEYKESKFSSSYDNLQVAQPSTDNSEYYSYLKVALWCTLPISVIVFLQLLPEYERQLKINAAMKEAKEENVAWELPYDATLTEEEKNFEEQTKRGDTLAKVLIKRRGVSKYKDLEIIKMLQDYNYRPALRQYYSFDRNSPYFKYVHMEDKIIEARPLVEKKARKKIKKAAGYTHTKKSSTTSISHKLHTELFHNGIGFGFDIKQSVIKAYLGTDQGTYLRNWVSESKSEVEQYRAKHRGQTFTDINHFKHEIDKENHTNYNEVLAKVNREGTSGIIACTNRKNFGDDFSVKDVLDLHAETKETINKDLPIGLYDHKHRQFRIATMAEVKLRALYNDVKNPYFSNMVKVDSEGFTGKVSRETATSIKDELDKLSKSLDKANVCDKDNHCKFFYPVANLYMNRAKQNINKLINDDPQKKVRI